MPHFHGLRHAIWTQSILSARAVSLRRQKFLVITYRTDIDAIRAVVPAPLDREDPIVKFEFIRMPNSTGFGDYTESGQVIPVSLNGIRGEYVHAMYLNDDAPIAGRPDPRAGRGCP